MSQYLVTGGAGFIGTNLVKRLLADGHGVVVLDNYAGGKKPERIQKGARYVEGDIRDVATLDAICKGIDGIFHLAALPRITFSVEHPWETHDANVNGTLQLLLAAKRHGIKRLVFSSSSSAYGDQTVFPLKEDVRSLPISPYALQKFIGEHYCRIFAELYGVETVSLRYFNIYGPYFDPDSAYALVIAKFLRQRKNNEPLTICGDGEYFRDFTHVNDAIQANILAMTSDKVGRGEVINIGNNQPNSVNYLAKLIGGKSIFVAERPGDIRRNQADITKAKQLLNWRPTITLEQGIKELKDAWGLD